MNSVLATIAPAMAAPARHKLGASEVIVINGCYHLYHPARDQLSRGIVRPIHLVGAGPDMTVRAVKTQGGRHDAHGPHEIVHGNPPEGGRHLTHVRRGMTCSICHNAVVTTTNGFVDKKLHVNGADNVKFGGTFQGSAVSGTFTTSTGTCAVSCHNTKRWR